MEWCFDGPNPIANYAVSLEMRVPLSQAALKAVSAGHPKVRGDLPRRLEQTAITFQMGGSAFRVGSISPQPAQGLGAVTFDTLNPDGSVRAALTVNQTSITYMTTDYTRWAEFWPVAERLFSTICRMIAPSPPFTFATLISVNKFRPFVEGSRPPLTSLIRNEAPYIAPNLLNRTGLGHSFHGFVDDSLPLDEQTTVNVNVTSGLINSKSEVDLTFQFRRNLRTDASAVTILTGKDSLGLGGQDGLFTSLHKWNNRMFEEIVISTLCDAIPGLSS